MSVSTEVQRTLVKSPPELWTELSNSETLARHLGDFGEIRITSAEPETKVEWEAEQAKGTVQLKQSGWGTKVTLSVTRTPTVPEPAAAEEPAAIADQEPEPAAVADPKPEPAAGVKPESEPTVVAEPEPEPEPTVIAEPEPEPEPTIVAEAEPEPTLDVEPETITSEPEPEPATIAEFEPKRGFFARLFRKRKAKPSAIVEPEPEVVAPATPEAEAKADPEPKIELVAMAAPEPIYPDPPAQPEASEPSEDLGSELESLEEQMAAETTELLTGVLDRLGAAHHRPFSRG